MRQISSVEERVIDLICERLGVSKEHVTRQASLVDDIGADSLDLVELTMGVEEEFRITIPDEWSKKLNTPGVYIDYVERELSKR